MNTSDIVTLFEQNDLFEKRIVLERNDFLKSQGSVDTNIYFVENGSFRIFIIDNDEERIVRFGYKNNIIVALDSFFTGQPSEFTIQAIKKSTVRIIPKKAFTAFLDNTPSFLPVWINILEDLVLQQMEREKDLLTNSLKERYERVLKRSPQLFQEIPNKYIANYLCMTPEILSRLKKS